MASKAVLAFAILALLLVSLTALAAGRPPEAVSPGEPDRWVQIRDGCPSFSWGAVPRSEGFELMVYAFGREPQENGSHAEPRLVLEKRLPGSVFSWTPSLESCLSPGGRYAWVIRAMGTQGASEWSEARLFEVPPGPSEAELEQALSVVREYFQAQGDASALERGPEERGASAGQSAILARSGLVGATLVTSAVAVTAGDPSLQVNGSPVVTVATFLGARCEAQGFRYLDQRDGTVLDCNTGLIWLKKADCFPGRTWSEAETDAAGLANGSCDLKDGSSAGDWRQPTISELCSAWSGSPALPCPAGAASDSLIDSSVAGTRKVVNSTGNVPWTEGDAFLGVAAGYWSATDSPPASAWAAVLDSGNVVSAAKTSVFDVWPVRDGE